MKRRYFLLLIFLITTAISTRGCWLMSKMRYRNGPFETFWTDSALITAFPGFLAGAVLPRSISEEYEDDPSLWIWRDAWLIAPAAGIFWTGTAWIILAGNSFLASRYRPQPKLGTEPHADELP